MKKNKMLYVHIPFCAKKCLFCSFAVSIGASHRVDDYLNALTQEAARYQGQVIDTVYFGGGTPSFLTPLQMERLITMIRKNFVIADKAHWSMEANPEGIDSVRAKQFYELGFTRMSLGIQSFNDTYLKFLGRAHDKLGAVKAYDILCEAGFDNINVDLMYGFPHQSREDLQHDLKALIDLKSQHVSLYTLTIEPNSRFYATQMKLDDEEKLADDYIYVTQTLQQAGLRQYEVSNFARQGFESRHNCGYWQGKEYIGLGMGAHSFLGNRRFWNVDTLNLYIEKIKQGNHACAGEEILDKGILMRERLIFGLRMNQGIDMKALSQEFSMPFPQEVSKEIEALNTQGFLQMDGHKVKVTDKGRLVLDMLAIKLLP